MVRLILIVEDSGEHLIIGKPRVSVIELKKKNAVLVDLPVEISRPALVDQRSLEGLVLNERQSGFLAALSRKIVTNQEYRRFFKDRISREAARLDLADLGKKGLLVKKGLRKGTVYHLAEKFINK